MRILTRVYAATIIALAVIAFPLTFLPGCSTTPTGSGGITPERAGAISRLAAWSGCTAALLSDPSSRETWTTTRDAIAAMEATERWDAASLSVILREHGIAELVGDEGTLSITAGILLIDVFTGAKVDIATVPHVRAVITGLRSGLDLALGHATKASRLATRERLKAAAISTR